MLDFLKSLSLNEEDLDSYINEKLNKLNLNSNYFEIDSSLVFSYANKIGHAYCLIKKKNVIL